MPRLHDGGSTAGKARSSREFREPHIASRTGDALSAKLAEIGKLSTGWDGRAAPAPDAAALAAADRVADAFRDLELKPDRIAATVDGGVMFALSCGRRYGDIECYNGGEVLAVLSDRKSEPEVWNVADDEIRTTLERIRDFVGR